MQRFRHGLGAVLLAVGICLGFLAKSPTLASEPNAKPGQLTPAGVEKITTVEGITEYRLPNGLRVLLFPDKSSPRVTVNITYFVGSRHEGYGESGMAHLLEHMVFKGTPRHQNIPKLLQERGAQFNGTTSFDRTNYFATLPASDDNLEFALRLEADRMVNSYIKREDLASEMTVVRNEFEQGENNPVGILIQRIWAAAFEWHNYGKTTIGNRSDIERVPIENLQAFYRRYYQPDNAMLVIAGAFEEAKALALVVKHFGALTKPERQLSATYTEEPTQDGERIVVLRRVGEVPLVGVGYRVPAGPHPDFPALQVLANVLSAEPAGKLYQALVATKLATEVFAFAQPLHDPGLLLIGAKVAVGQDVTKVREVLLTAVQECAAALTQADVDRARRELVRARELQATDASRVAIQLSEWAAQGDWRLYFRHRDLLEQVTLSDVQRVAQTYLKTDNRTVGVFVPTPKPERIAMPRTPDVQQLVGNYTGRSKVAEGEEFDPTPANIDARTERGQLPSGIKLAALAKKNRGETVNLRLTLRFGNEESLKPYVTASEFLGPWLLRGTQKLDFAQLRDEWTKASARVAAASGPGFLSFSVSTKREHLPRVVELLGQVLREPAFSAKEFEVLKNNRLTELEQARTEPQALAQLLLQRTLNPYPADDVRYVPSLDEAIARVRKLDGQQIKELYEQFLSGSAGELIIVGDADVPATVQAISQLMLNWTSSQPYARIQRPGKVTQQGQTLRVVTPDKANAVYMAGLQLQLRDDDPDYPALLLGNYILGQGALSSRLGDRIRQKEGLSYGVGSFLSVDSLDPRATLVIFAICNPANMPRVDAAVREELIRFLTDGVTEKELSDAKQGLLQAARVRRTRDQALVELLGENLRAGRTMAFNAAVEERLAALKADEVVSAFRKYITPERLVIIHAGDLEPKAP